MSADSYTFAVGSLYCRTSYLHECSGEAISVYIDDYFIAATQSV